MSPALVVGAIGTGLIVAIVVVVVIVVLLLTLLPRLRRASQEKRLERRRGELADSHRTDAENRRIQADLAEQEAQRRRAEAGVLDKQAELHDRGLADHEIRGEGAERGRGEREADPPRDR